jgi:hypothetical protein
MAFGRDEQIRKRAHEIWEQEGRPDREGDVHRRAGERDDQRVVARLAHPPGVHRDRLRVAEDRAGREGEDRRQDERAEDVDVRHGVQGEPPGLLGGVVSEAQRRPAVRDLVDDHRRHEDGDQDEDLLEVDRDSESRRRRERTEGYRSQRRNTSPATTIGPG